MGASGFTEYDSGRSVFSFDSNDVLTGVNLEDNDDEYAQQCVTNRANGIRCPPPPMKEIVILPLRITPFYML